MPLDVEKLWAQFIDAQGDEVEAWVATELRKSSGQFEYADGTHAKWVDGGNLGLLLTFQLDELVKVLSAWEEAHEEHNEFAAEWIMGWIGNVMTMLGAAAENPLS